MDDMELERHEPTVFLYALLATAERTLLTTPLDDENRALLREQLGRMLAVVEGGEMKWAGAERDSHA